MSTPCSQEVQHLRALLLGKLHAQRQGATWRGRLSSSALATAVAMLAYRHGGVEAEAIAQGAQWLRNTQQADGGWGDTPASPANLSTSLLCWAALPTGDAALPACERYLHSRIGSLSPVHIQAAVEGVYGNDRTFAVPILCALALAGRLGPEASAWGRVRQLPFPLAVLPRQLFTVIRLPVVSYALPALIAIGLVRHRRVAKRGCPLAFLLERFAGPSLKRLQAMQPASGGFLEAVPLTAFVCMSLSGAGEHEHPVCRRGLEFLRQSQREDGSWPIDSDLATWLTSLAVNACGLHAAAWLPNAGAITEHLLAQQSAQVHPYTGAAAGAWAWTDRSGGVPDADDTAGAVLALRYLPGQDQRRLQAAQRGLRWLLQVQNRDGGIPTFCKGWGALPFDRSSPDLTAHFLRAALAWLGTPAVPPGLSSGLQRALRYVQAQQQPDGSWIPLWFGNQAHPQQHNPVYGTAKVLLALADPRLPSSPSLASACQRAVAWLLSQQHADGGWGSGGRSLVEETGLAVEALRQFPQQLDAQQRGLAFLCQAWSGQDPEAQPIGLYFASLWYDEQLYPLLMSLAACR